MITHTITRTYKDQGSSVIQLAESISGNLEHNLDVAAVPIAANTQYVFAVTRANLQCLGIYASGACSIFTNNPSGSSPQDTIPIAAGQTRLWTLLTDLIALCPFSGNVTSIYVTNAGGSTIALKIRSLLNQ